MPVRPVLWAAAVALCAGTLQVTPAASATTTGIVTPGSFRGYGFDQCDTPSQRAMDAWLRHSPYLAVGVYSSGDSRACKTQANLTKTWVATQSQNGWKVLPITVGPQAPCTTIYGRTSVDLSGRPQVIDRTGTLTSSRVSSSARLISNDPGKDGMFRDARRQGRAEGQQAVDAAAGLGISAGSTLWYDLEGFNAGITRCRNASLAFLSGWTTGLHRLGYLSGVYSSAGSGIWMLDRARLSGATSYHLPDQIWLAQWDGDANTRSSYVTSDGWRPGGRMKQYLGGHNERWGGVTINIDRNFLSLGAPAAPKEAHCGGVAVDFPDYPRVGSTSDPLLIKALQCLLSEQTAYAGNLDGALGAGTVTAMNAWQQAHGLAVRPYWNRRSWMTLLASGEQPVLKVGSTGPAVRALQRTLNAATRGADLAVTGLFTQPTSRALQAWQGAVGRAGEGVANPGTWTALAGGLRPQG